ncbi:SRPBCC family protein [Nocardia sp. CDC159]|uniref:SRPBCC family protein n=1 Tax=Nocardia pulmonis TaxID=2951408 RepID=A0A9X2E772_9NOCA|nr:MULTISPECIES: SRPBCC family protein [Nocardia]MCM6774906.1 SRPBCC family protein [Nocardia pulmonis]MCM6789837.1 SRPBCC family protein [Nocardia sp. CDC159]
MAEFEISRETVIAADAARVRDLIVDFREWKQWSPWEDLDPDLQRTYTGAESGVGAHYAWDGNRKAGRGSMEITGVTDDTVDIRLVFEKPWRATHRVTFTLVPADTGTTVTWRMVGERNAVTGLLAKVIPMDSMIGRDFDKGLERLRKVAEA